MIRLKFSTEFMSDFAIILSVCLCYEERLSPVVAAEAAYPDRQAAALLSNGSVLKA
jgi:hypothetical protein